MAGLSKRFTDAGYELPKYMLEAKGKTLFEHAVGSFENYFDQCKFVFIARDIFNTPEFIDRQCKKMGISNYEIVALSQPTGGQAETVFLGLAQASIAPDEAVLIHNIDTFRPGFEFPGEIENWDGYLEVFKGGGPNWSYAKPKDFTTTEVIETAEKVEISDLCSTGLYYFRSWELYSTAYKNFFATDVPGLKEYYIAPMYNYLIKNGSHVHYHLIGRDEVIFCGTPAEYDQFQQI